VLRRLARLLVGAVICSHLPRGSGNYSESMSCMNNSVYAQRSELPIAWTCKTYALAYGFLGLSDKPSRPLLRHFRFVLL
jgi:hypothetical protein